MAGYEYFVTQFSVVDENKSFRGNTAGVNYFFLNGLIDKFFANWIVMLLKAVYFMTNFSNHITTTKIPLLSLFCLKL